MKTKEYRIKITTNDIEHKLAKKRIENLFRQLNKNLDGDMEFYIQTIEIHYNWGNKPYSLGIRKNLTLIK